MLLALGRRGGRPPEGSALATFVALGIGLHNLGEGLAIGAAFAVGEVALASFLVLGFALHNVTEGIAIAAPLHDTDFRLRAPAGGALLRDRRRRDPAGGRRGRRLRGAAHARSHRPRAVPSNAAGFVAGLALMYGTALAVTG